MAAVIKNFDIEQDGKRYSYRRSSQDVYKWAVLVFPKGKNSLLDVEDSFFHTFATKYVTKAQVLEAFAEHLN